MRERVHHRGTEDTEEIIALYQGTTSVEPHKAQNRSSVPSETTDRQRLKPASFQTAVGWADVRRKRYTRPCSLRHADVTPSDIHQTLYLLPLLLVPEAPLRTFTIPGLVGFDDHSTVHVSRRSVKGSFGSCFKYPVAIKSCSDSGLLRCSAV